MRERSSLECDTATGRGGRIDAVNEVYDKVGASYRRTRRADPRIAAAIAGALGDARSVVNVGAGSGGYEPADREVLAIEPSATMIRSGRRRPLPRYGRALRRCHWPTTASTRRLP
jgi:hypothetical protein